MGEKEKEKQLTINLIAVPNWSTPKGTIPGKVMMHFTAPVTNISFSAEEAHIMAQKIAALAVDAAKTIDVPEEVDRGNKGPRCEHCGQALPTGHKWPETAPTTPTPPEPMPEEKVLPPEGKKGDQNEDSGDRPGE